MEFLSSSEIKAVNGVSLRALGEVGVVVNSRRVVDMLIGAGAGKSKDGMRVLIPESMVKSSLSSVPKSLLLASRDGKRDMQIPTTGPVFVANGGEGVYVKDLITGQSRSASTDDLRDFISLVHALQPVDFAWAMVGALDQPNNKKNAVELKVCLENTTKHIQGGATSAIEARANIEMLSAVSGGFEGFEKRPFFSAIQCPISPMTFEEGLVEAQVEFARAGVPVVAMVAAVAGLTSPVTLSGTLAQTNAENLASLVISQTAKKGAPWIFSSDSSPGDLKVGSINYGALESNLLRAGAGQLGRYHGVPTMCAGCGLEETSIILADVREGVPYMSLMGLVDSDLASGFGGIDNAAGASFEQLVLDAWVWDTSKEFLRTFGADQASISFETIRDAALDGSFLSKRHTLTRFKKESAALTKPEAIFSGRPSSRGRMDLLKRAKKEATSILGAPRVPVTTKEESAALERIVKGL
jgi:trimethylamine--corrinoid protein Co-methyltransferase